MVITRSTSITTNSAKHSTSTADTQPSTSETLDGIRNREESIVELEESQPIDEDLNLGMVWPPPEQELDGILIEEL